MFQEVIGKDWPFYSFMIAQVREYMSNPHVKVAPADVDARPFLNASGLFAGLIAEAMNCSGFNFNHANS